MLIGRSPVRISFAGGGTDLPAYYEQFGGMVLSATINKYFYTILGKRTDGRVQVISSDLRVFETWRDIANMEIKGNGLEIPLAVLKDLARDVSVDIFLASEIPPGTGLGSSASVCVNLLNTLATYLQRPISKPELAERSFRIAHEILGWHVGKQDEYAAALGGLNFMRFQKDGTVEVDPLELESSLLRELEASLMLFFTGSSRHSRQILEEQEATTRIRRGPAVDALHRIRSLAEQMRDALVAGNLRAFGELLNESWQSKKRVSGKISNPQIDRLYEVARNHGAVGGKITGAGGGGFLLLYCEPSCQQAVRDAMQREGVQEMVFALDFVGARVIVNDPFIDGDERSGMRWRFFPATAAHS